MQGAVARFLVCVCLLLSCVSLSGGEKNYKEVEEWIKASDLTESSAEIILGMLKEEEISDVKHAVAVYEHLKRKPQYRQLTLGAAKDFHEHVESTLKIDHKDEDGRTALMRAAAHGRLDVVKNLIKKGARTALKDNSGRTALHWAQYGKHTEIMKALAVVHLQRKEVNEKDDDHHFFSFHGPGYPTHLLTYEIIAVILLIAGGYFFGIYMLFKKVKHD